MVSKPGEESVKVGEEPAIPKPAGEYQESAAKESAPTATAAPAASTKPKGSVPRPSKRDVTEEEKAIFRARAKAWAAEKKKK